MEIHSIGYHHSHDADFLMEKPNGIGQAWLFLLFHTKAMVRIDKTERIVPPNSFLLYSGETPQYYGACEEAYMDDWFYFTIESRDLRLFQELGILCNEPVSLADAGAISALIRSMTYEFYTPRPYHVDMMELSLKQLFFQIGRQLQETKTIVPQSPSVKLDNLMLLHYRITHQIGNVGTVASLAKDFSMSLSSLQHSYKAVFGETISNDITKSRLEKVRLLLTTTSLPLRQVAEQCGYSSEFHLMRHFKANTAMTPTEFRRKNR